MPLRRAGTPVKLDPGLAAHHAAKGGALLRRNLMVYGLGGIIIPFIGIKAIDLIVAALHLA